MGYKNTSPKKEKIFQLKHSEKYSTQKTIELKSQAETNKLIIGIR
jgi:hypothetical protein